MTETQYRIYADGTVVHEDDFQEYDGYDDSQPFGDDYRTVSVPDEVVDYIAESCSVSSPMDGTDIFYKESKEA